MTIAHAIVAGLVSLIVSLVPGCLKEPEAGPAELGPQATEDQMELAVSKALYGVNPWGSALGQQVIYDFNVRIEASPEVQPILRLTQTVISREQLTNPDRLRMVVQNYEQELPSERFTERNESDPIEFPGTGAGAVGTMSKVWSKEMLETIHGTLKPAADDRPVKRITYHNLREASGEMTPPPLVMAKDNCGGVPNCRLRYYQIEYDEASWYTDSEFSVKRWTFTISRDAPWVTYIMERCLRSLVEYQGRKILMRQCQYARDFSYSGATAP